MNGIKLGFSLADLAKTRNMGIGSARLKDGSSLKILADADKNAVDLFQVRNGYLVGAKGYRGKDTMHNVLEDIAAIADNWAVSSRELLNAWGDALYRKIR